MESTAALYSSLILIFLLPILRLLLQFSGFRPSKNLPPSPPRLPFIGHLHLLKPPIHRTFHKLSRTYGPIFSLRFGSRLIFVVSSPSIAEECFTTNDVVLANRPLLLVGKHIGYNYTTMASSPYGSHWRNLRKIGAIEIFSFNRLNMYSYIRKDEVRRLLCRLARDSRQGFTKVELKSLFSDLTLNNMMRMVAGKKYCGDEVSNEKEANEFKEVISTLLELAGASHPGDFLPVLKWVGHNYEKKVKNTAKRMDEILQGLIDEKRRYEEEGNSVIDHLLALQQSEPDYYNDQIIKGLIMIMLVAGTDTTGITIEWAMSNLLNHPNALQKAQTELDTLVGVDRVMNESDLPKLSYLNAIILETLRLYPASPLLVPHESSDECKIGGYHIPRGTMVLVNAWGIHRDPKVWDDPASFRPERFEAGQGGDAHYKLVPFGAGRRACPGMMLGIRTVGLVLGSLIQSFEWKRVGDKEIDMGEGKGITMPKAHPLIAMCKPRDVLDKFLSCESPSPYFSID